MSTENSTVNISSLSFNQKHSLAIRIWHWLTYIALTGTLITVLLASTLFKTKNNIAMVQGQLQQKGIVVSKDQARSVAHEYSDKLWDTHKIIGFVICFLLVSRLIIEIMQPGDEKLKTKIKNALSFRSTTMIEKNERKHFILVKRGYVLFYFTIATMAITGLGLAFEDAPYLKDIQHLLRNIHSFLQYFIYAYLLFHIVGVILAETGQHKGIVSGMIHGKKS